MRMPLDEFVKTDGNREAFERIANITQPKLTFTAYAVQKDGMDTAAAAWAAANP